MNQLLISFDLAVGAGSFSLWEEGALVEKVNVGAIGAKSDEAVSILKDLLDRNARTLKDICTVLCTRGPGGYTGIRTGLATAHGLKRALGVDVYGYSVLEVLHSLEETTECAAVVLEGGRNEALVSIRRGIKIESVEFIGPERLNDFLLNQDVSKAVLAVSSNYNDKLSLDQDRIGILNAYDDVSVALVDFHSRQKERKPDLSPIYGRAFG